MTIDEAIKTLEEIRRTGHYQPTRDDVAAVELGTEALKHCKERSDRFPNLPHLRLPGETKG